MASMKPLSAEEKKIILDKGTERPFSGEYCHCNKAGLYSCKQCGSPLYRSTDKFDAGCGWPSFDDEVSGAVTRLPDADGCRTEIVCAKCGAHLGHVFLGEGLTAKNVRHCVNSISLEFTPQSMSEMGVDPSIEKTETAIFSGGCFWGVAYFMKQLPGVLSVITGYTGGKIPHPTYQAVCAQRTGHAEAVQILFNPSQISYEILAKRFFEIHDPEQSNRQGPDIGDQYRSEIFYTTPEQKEVALQLIDVLNAKGYSIATKVTPATTFWTAEETHQHYYEKTGTEPYCHRYVKRF